MKYKILKNERKFLKFSIASAINRFGDSIDVIALTWLVYALSGDAIYSAINFGINYLPTIILTPFMGAFIEKRNKKLIMTLSDILRSILVIVIIILYTFHHLNVYFIMIITCLISVLETLRVPASTTFITLIISSEKYDIAQSFYTSCSKMLEILGTGLAGIFLSMCGVIFTLVIDSISFFISGVIVYSIYIQEENINYRLSTLSLFKQGFIYAKNKPSLIFLCMICCCANAFLVPLNAFSSALSVEVYHDGPKIISYLNMGFSIGSVLGSIAYPHISSFFYAKKIIRFLFLGTGIFYIISIVISYLPTLSVYLLLFIIALFFGIIIVIANMYSQIMILNKVESSYLSRFSAIMNSLCVSVVPVISFIMSYISSIISIKIIFVLTGIFAMIIGEVILFLSVDEVIEENG